MYLSNGEHNSNHPTRSSSLIAFKELHLQEGSTNINEDFAESCWLSRPAAQVFQMSATLAADVSKCIQMYPVSKIYGTSVSSTSTTATSSQLQHSSLVCNPHRNLRNHFIQNQQALTSAKPRTCSRNGFKYV